MYWEMTMRLGGWLAAARTAQMFGWAKILELKSSIWVTLQNSQVQLRSSYYLSAGNSVWKSLEILAVTSWTFRILATISFCCHFPRHNSPECDSAILKKNESFDDLWKLKKAYLCDQVQRRNINSGVSGESCITSTRLRTLPSCVFEWNTVMRLAVLMGDF